MKKRFRTTYLPPILIVLLAVISSFNYAIFVFPNKFAPTGLDGVCTMIQDILDINIGYLALLVNIPLLLFAYFSLDRRFTFLTLLYVLAFSLSSILITHIDISALLFHTESGTSIVLAPFAAGAVRGLLYAATLTLHGTAGGADIIAALLHKKKPHLPFMNILFFFNVTIALCSYFVYGMRFEPVICSILYSFITSNVGTRVLALRDQAVKFEIITPNADALCHTITNDLHQSATLVDAHGSYSGTNRKMVICVVEKEKEPILDSVLTTLSDTVVFKSRVSHSHIQTFHH